MNEDRAAEQLKLAREDAAAACERLRIAIEKLFWRWEIQHGFRKGAGVILVPAGYRPGVDK